MSWFLNRAAAAAIVVVVSMFQELFFFIAFVCFALFSIIRKFLLNVVCYACVCPCVRSHSVLFGVGR